MTVPTVDLGFLLMLFCSMLMAGRKALDIVDVRLFHQLEELPRVGREGLDVSPLPFRVDRIEGEGRLARAARPGDDGHLVSRQLYVDVLEVVLPGALYENVFHDIDSLPLNGAQRPLTGQSPASLPAQRLASLAAYHRLSGRPSGPLTGQSRDPLGGYPGLPALETRFARPIDVW